MIIPHRSTTLVAIIILIALWLFSTSTSTSSSSDVPRPAKPVSRPKLPILDTFRFRPAAHRPPEQQNSSSGESKWYSDWKWLNPFSSSITLDENRAVLPPLRERLPVYTFYDPSGKNDGQEQEADRKLLLAWRRAWYAQGFRPVVLTHAEARSNQHYEAVQQLNIDPALNADFLRWLAWELMGTGLLADWRCFPMARYDDPLLSHLRRGVVPTHITRFENFDGGLFAAEKSRINDAIKEAIKMANNRSKSLLDVIPAEYFKVQRPTALALYNSATIATHYPALAERHVTSSAAGRLALTELINTHLHITFQNSFPAGIAVLRPLPEYTTALVEPAVWLAKAIAQCSSSMQLTPCPPNRPRCQPCSPSAKSMPVSQPPTFKNTSNLFTIGVVPHPYTLISLQSRSDDITARYIRRETPRDPWLIEVTKQLLTPERGGPSRVIVFKDIVAGEGTVGHSLWIAAEDLTTRSEEDLPSGLLDGLEWRFGFTIPRGLQANGKTRKDPEPEDPDFENNDIVKLRSEELAKQYTLLKEAQELLKSQSKNTNKGGIISVAEAWNLADAEMWRFVKAYHARDFMERQKWEEDEKYFVGPRVG